MKGGRAVGAPSKSSPSGEGGICEACGANDERGRSPHLPVAAVINRHFLNLWRLIIAATTRGQGFIWRLEIAPTTGFAGDRFFGRLEIAPTAPRDSQSHL